MLVLTVVGGAFGWAVTSVPAWMSDERLIERLADVLDGEVYFWQATASDYETEIHKRIAAGRGVTLLMLAGDTGDPHRIAKIIDELRYNRRVLPGLNPSSHIVFRGGRGTSAEVADIVEAKGWIEHENYLLRGIAIGILIEHQRITTGQLEAAFDEGGMLTHFSTFEAAPWMIEHAGAFGPFLIRHLEYDPELGAFGRLTEHFESKSAMNRNGELRADYESHAGDWAVLRDGWDNLSPQQIEQLKQSMGEFWQRHAAELGR